MLFSILFSGIISVLPTFGLNLNHVASNKPNVSPTPIRMAKLKYEISKFKMLIDPVGGDSVDFTSLCKGEIDVPVYDVRVGGFDSMSSGQAPVCKSSVRAADGSTQDIYIHIDGLVSFMNYQGMDQEKKDRKNFEASMFFTDTHGVESRAPVMTTFDLTHLDVEGFTTTLMSIPKGRQTADDNFSTSIELVDSSEVPALPN